MKIYLNPEYKDHKKLERAILEEFPEISAKSAKYKGGKKKATFVYKETCYKFDNRDDLLLTLKELLEYTERKEKLGASVAASDEEKTLKDKSDKKTKSGKADKKEDNEVSRKPDKDSKKKEKAMKGRKDGGKARLDSQTSSGTDILVVLPEETEEHTPTLKEILKSKDYEQIDEAFYGETTFEETDDQEVAEDSQTGSYEASLPKSSEKDDDEIMSDTFGDAEGQKVQTYEVEDIEEAKESDIVIEMGYIESDSEDSEGRISYDESIPLSEGKDDLEIMEEAYDDFEKSKTSPSEGQESEEEQKEVQVQPDELMRELGYLEGEESKGQDQVLQQSEKQETAVATHRKAGSVEDRSGNRVPPSHGTNEIVLQVPVEKYNLNDLNIKIKFGHFNEPSSTYEIKKKP